jgi:hypothetical protein
MIWFVFVESESSGPMYGLYLIEEENGLEEIGFVSTFGAKRLAVFQ